MTVTFNSTKKPYGTVKIQLEQSSVAGITLNSFASVFVVISKQHLHLSSEMKYRKTDFQSEIANGKKNI